MFNSLNLFLDKHSLIKLQESLQNSTSEFPIFWQKDSYTTHLLIWKCHKRRYHCGLNNTLNESRQLFWVTKDRQNVKESCKIRQDLSKI